MSGPRGAARKGDGMAKTRFRPDHGLSTRMVWVMFLLGLLYVVFIGVFIALGVNPALVLVFALGFLAVQWYLSDRLALASMGAREVTPEEAPELHGIIDRLCAMADMPKPRVAIADMDLPNAFAAGRSRKNAVVVVTTGIMRKLDRDELEGVLSHELSHVAHNDVTVMTIASFIGILAGFLARMGMYARIGNNRDQRAALVWLVVLLVSILTYAISFLLIRALSRYRELAADRAGAYLTGHPSALASALTKISGDMAAVPTKDLRKVEPVNAFCLVPAMPKGSLSRIFSTHPTLERRIEELAKVANDLGRPL
jgi:heat shock protein HtpX